ncbi:hypothetical protein J437_LFUL006679 [Ladona fulva]|uniref:Uncharacterized protein n=1 Tax=Ladona fulva TaxID=123851 RepID=A0A8K0NY66_LADFU|nr:hypothetical protein J437_LFUL006679 [Ladona fulva]
MASTIIETEIPQERQSREIKPSRPAKFDLMRKIGNERRELTTSPSCLHLCSIASSSSKFNLKTDESFWFEVDVEDAATFLELVLQLSIFFAAITPPTLVSIIAMCSWEVEMSCKAVAATINSETAFLFI